MTSYSWLKKYSLLNPCQRRQSINISLHYHKLVLHGNFFLSQTMILSFFHDHRDFIETHYVPVKQSNPNFPILIRECSDIQPRVWARYGMCNFGNLLALAILEVYVKIDSVVCWMFWRNEAYCASIYTSFSEKLITLGEWTIISSILPFPYWCYMPNLNVYQGLTDEFFDLKKILILYKWSCHKKSPMLTYMNKTTMHVQLIV